MALPEMGKMNFFATAAKGVEQLVADELQRLGISPLAIESGGVRFAGDFSTCLRANLWLRTASRILVPLAVFPCSSPQELYDGVRTINWNSWITPEMTMAVDCSLRESAMTHSGFVALKTKDAVVDEIRDRCGRRPSVNTRDPDLRVNVHLARNSCTISLDSSGAPLDRRGYRLEKTDAPLRETLAAALLEFSGWDGTTPLFDPMCGSGTILIEGALKAARRAPGMTREGFGFQRWPGFDPSLWEQTCREAKDKELSSIPHSVSGSDRSAKALAIAGKNASRAGVLELITFARQDFSEFAPPPGPGVIIFNPPYGQRLGDEEALKPLYRQIGDVLKQRCAGYTAYILTGSSELAKNVGLRASRRFVLFNGPLECRLLKYELY